VPAVLPRADSPCPTNSNTQSLLDDDDPPPVSEALALPSHLIQKPSATTTIPHTPRVTVRATTSDGKTIYLRKRKKPSLTVSRSYIGAVSYLTRMFSDSDYVNSKDGKFACSSYSQTYGRVVSCHGRKFATRVRVTALVHPLFILQLKNDPLVTRILYLKRLIRT
jgi:hypothetical protein